MGDVVTFDAPTRLDIPAERVIKSAAELKFDGVVVVGYLENGDFYFASSYADGGDVVWLLELAKKKLLEVDD
jgi:hypothetical protein